MRLNRIFNTVNNKERGHGQRSVVGSSMVSLACITSMCSVQCFPGGHSLRSALGSFFYRPILAIFRCFGQTVFFLRCLRLRLAFVQSLFLRNLGRQSWRDVRPCVWPWGFAWVFRLSHHGLKVRQQLVCGVFFARRNDCDFCAYLLSGQAVHERSCPRA